MSATQAPKPPGISTSFVLLAAASRPRLGDQQPNLTRGKASGSHSPCGAPLFSFACTNSDSFLHVPRGRFASYQTSVASNKPSGGLDAEPRLQEAAHNCGRAIWSSTKKYPIRYASPGIDFRVQPDLTSVLLALEPGARPVSGLVAQQQCFSSGFRPCSGQSPSLPSGVRSPHLS